MRKALNTFTLPHRRISPSTKELYIKSGPSSENYSCHPFRSFLPFALSRRKKTARHSSSGASAPLPPRESAFIFFRSPPNTSPFTFTPVALKGTTTKMHGPSTRCAVFRRGWAFKRISLPPLRTFLWTLSAFCSFKGWKEVSIVFSK